MPTPTTIAITGATGHLASSIIPLLQNKGYRIRALQYEQALYPSPTNLETIKGSLANISSLNDLVKGCDVVIHCAAKISINSNKDDSVYDTNVNGVKNIFNAAKSAGVKRFLYTSSIHAYSQFPVHEILDEAHPLCGPNAARYDQSKRDAQQFVLQQAAGDPMEVVVLNPTSIIGPNDRKPSLMGQAILSIYKGEIPALIRGGFDFCDVRDVAQGVVSAIDHGRNGQSYLLGGKWCSLAELHQIIMDTKGDTRKIPVIPPWIAYLGLPFIHLLASIKGTTPLYTKESIDTLKNSNQKISSAKAAQELAYICRPLEETIADSISWFKQAGYL